MIIRAIPLIRFILTIASACRRAEIVSGAKTTDSLTRTTILPIDLCRRSTMATFTILPMPSPHVLALIHAQPSAPGSSAAPQTPGFFYVDTLTAIYRHCGEKLFE